MFPRTLVSTSRHHPSSRELCDRARSTRPRLIRQALRRVWWQLDRACFGATLDRARQTFLCSLEQLSNRIVFLLRGSADRPVRSSGAFKYTLANRGDHVGEFSSDDPPNEASSELFALSVHLAERGVRDSGQQGEVVEFARTTLKECWREARQPPLSPWTFYRMGVSYLYLNKPYSAFAACAKALQLSNTQSVINAAYDALSVIDASDEELVACGWMRRLLLIGTAGRFHAPGALSELQVLASQGAPPIAPPVTILAGGCRANDDARLPVFRPLVIDAFRAYTGTIISGGTRIGVCSLAGDVQEAFPESIHAIGYVPRGVTDTPLDDRYREIRLTPDSDFSVTEVTQYWCDLVASGVSPSQVKVFGIDGGSISASEYKMALALGASVALLEGSGREAKKLRHNRHWRASQGLVCIPADSYIIEEFIKPHPQQLDTADRERLARVIHDTYRERERGVTTADDPSIAPWDELPSYLKHSNRAQADRIFEKVERIGYTVEKRTGGTATPVTDFTPGELTVMAQMEHSRGVVECLNGGWMPGPRRDVRHKISPYLVPWRALPEYVKDKKRTTVRNIPTLLGAIGLQVGKTGDE